MSNGGQSDEAPVPDGAAAAGRAARRRAPRSTLGEWAPPSDRFDPVAVLSAQESARVPELLPLRHERMAASPFAFYRGAAAIMAADLAPIPRTDLTVQLCGDAHLSNFGVFAGPDRELVFDLNDFDETLPGPFEWDVARLVASFEIAARSLGLPRKTRNLVVADTARAYVIAMREFAAMGHLDVWYARLTPAMIRGQFGTNATARMMERFERNLAKAQKKDRLRAFDKLVTTESGAPRFRSDPPVLVPVDDLLPDVERDQVVEAVTAGIESYRATLPYDRQHLLDSYSFVDLARKVVGVGSVGTRCWVALLIGRTPADPLFLQVKEAFPSVLEAHLGASAFDQSGQRVVEGQRLIQSATDVFLGWNRLGRLDGGVSDYYFRQLWDWKGSAEVETMEPEGLSLYGRVCGRVLARAHARTGDAVALAAYLGGGTSFAGSMVRFAATYADQNESDFARYVEWVSSNGEAPAVASAP